MVVHVHCVCQELIVSCCEAGLFLFEPVRQILLLMTSLHSVEMTDALSFRTNGRNLGG